jgi:RNAse (barnase) inhibitor barstar
MHDLTQGLQDASTGGVFQLGADVRAVERAAKDAGLAWFRIDIHAAHDKGDLLAALAKGLAFPDWFGGNWDALADCLTDLEWHDAKGYVVVLDKAKHFVAGHARDWKAALEVLRHASDYWREEAVPFWVFVAGPEGWKSGLPEWPGSGRADTNAES